MAEWNLAFGETQRAEAGDPLAAAGQGQGPGKRADIFRPDPERVQCCLRGIGVPRSVGDRLQALADRCQRPALLRIPIRIADDAEKFEIIIPEDDGVVGRSFLRAVQPARRQSKAKPPVKVCTGLQVANQKISVVYAKHGMRHGYGPAVHHGAGVGSPIDSINRFAQLKNAAPCMTSEISSSERPALRSAFK